MPTRKIGSDARGKVVRVDDYLITKRGRTYTACWTEKPLIKRRTIRVLSATEETYSLARLDRVFRVGKISTRPWRNKARWARMYEKYVKPIKRKAARRRRRAASAKMRWCPVCINGHQPTRFKIGVPVWKGKKLRVCSTGCKRRVRKQVRILREKHPQLEPELVRRQLAYQYMRAGGQL